MQNGTITSAVNIGGIGFTSTITRTAEGQISHVVDLPAGIAGNISAAGGVDTLPTGHGYLANDVIDVHWTDVGGVQRNRRGLVVATSSANAITFSGGTPAGDALPATGYAVVTSKQIPVLTAWIGNDTEMVAVRMSNMGVADIRDASSSVQVTTLAAGAAWYWANGQGVTNPLASKTLAKIVVSNGSTASGTCHIGVLYQSVE